MSVTIEKLTHEALTLSETERAHLAQTLLQSLEPAEEGVEQEWAIEVGRRLERLRQGVGPSLASRRGVPRHQGAPSTVKQIIIDSEAENEFSDSVTFYERGEPGLDLEFERAAREAVQTIQACPEHDPLQKDGTRRLIMERFPFVIH